MEKIGSYVYQNSFYGKTAQAAKEAESAKAANVKSKEASGSRKSAPLSTAAQKLLKELQKTYGSMDFIVADYETEEEAAALLSRGTKEYSALLTAEDLEKMAADDSVKEKNLQILDDAVAKLDEMKTSLGDSGKDVSRVGISISDNGEVSFFAELEKNSERQRERIEKNREEKREMAREEAKKAEAERLKPDVGRPAGKRTMVYASTAEELAEKIKAVDWNTVKEDGFRPVGQRFDFTV